MNVGILHLAISPLHKGACGILTGLSRDLKIHYNESKDEIVYLSKVSARFINFHVAFNILVVHILVSKELSNHENRVFPY